MSRTNPANNPKLAARIASVYESGGAIAVIATLTGKQLAFVEEYVKDFNAVRALGAAGYEFSNEANARKAAFNMLGHPAVKIAVRHYTELRVEKSTVDVQFVLDKVLRVIEKAESAEKPDFNAVLRACELLAKHLGMMKEKVEVTGADGGPIQHEEIKEDADKFTDLIGSMAKRHHEETKH